MARTGDLEERAPMRSPLHPGPLALTALLLGGCGEMQPAVPTERSIPLAIFMVVGAVVPTLPVTRWLLRRGRDLRDPETGWSLPVGPVRRTMAIAMGAAAVVAAPLAAVAFYLVGLSFAEAHVDVFTYEDVVVFSAVLLGVATLVWCLLLGAAGGLCSSSAPTRRRTRVAVWTATALTVPMLASAIPIALVLAGMLYSSRNVVPEPGFPDHAARSRSATCLRQA